MSTLFRIAPTYRAIRTYLTLATYEWRIGGSMCHAQRNSIVCVHGLGKIVSTRPGQGRRDMSDLMKSHQLAITIESR